MVSQVTSLLLSWLGAVETMKSFRVFFAHGLLKSVALCHASARQPCDWMSCGISGFSILLSEYTPPTPMLEGY